MRRSDIPQRRVDPVGRGRWAVVDQDDRTLYAGGPRECEDWLDADENARRLAGTRRTGCCPGARLLGRRGALDLRVGRGRSGGGLHSPGGGRRKSGR